MQVITKRAGFVVVALLACTISVSALQPVRQQAPVGASGGNGASGADRLPHYVLGPNDEITIQSVDASEIANKPIRIAPSGDINLPLTGRIHAAGMTVEELEAEITERLKIYIRKPEIAVAVTAFKSQPVSVFGAVASPGIVQLEGRKTLIEVLSAVGGLTQQAGSRIRITRRSEWGLIPLSSAVAEGEYSVAEVDYLSIIDATRPQDNIQILPQDVISVSRADIIYVLGEVKTPGGFALTDRRTLSLIEVLARAGGLGTVAQGKDAKIIRPVPGSNRIEIPVNLNAVLEGKVKDIEMRPDDILYVPTSYAKGAFRRTLDNIIQMTTGVLIYR